MSQIYKDNHETLEELLDQAGSAQGASLLIPDLQRPYVWSPQQVIYLVDSLVRGWPFGSLLLWSVSEEDVAKMPSRQFSMVVARDHGTTDTVPQRLVPAHYRMVLDGQQRVQSLLLAFGGDGWGFKLEDRTWHEALNNKRPRGRYYVRHWSTGELCVDLEKFADEFTRTQSLAALEFEKVLTWVVRDPQNGQSAWKKPKNYEEPLFRSSEHPGRFIRLSRLWFALRTSNPSLAQIRQSTEDVLTEHGVSDELKARVQDAIMEMIQTLQSVKATRVTFLEVNRYTGADMGTPESYSDAVVTIFTRLNTAGRTLTREEITFAWIKSGWDPSKTENRGASDCFTQLRDELKREAKLDLDLDSLVAGVSIVWAVRYNGGKILANADLLKGDRVRPMAAEIAEEWHRISRSVLDVSRMVSERGYQFGRHYGSLNSLALMWAWWYAGAKWEASHALREVDRDALSKCREDGFMLYLDRWLIASQWAGRWGGSSSSTYLDNFCSTLSVAAAGTDALQTPTPKGSVQVLTDAWGSLISAFAVDANNFIETLEVESRNRVRGYYLPLWIWHRLDKNRWSASSIPLRTRKKDGTLDVDHIVSIGLCSDYGYQTQPGEDEENIPPDRVNINAIGNCWLLETTFNIAKSKEPARDFLGKVIEFKDDPQELLDWEGNIELPPAMVAPDKDKPQETAEAINQRTRDIKDELKKFISGALARVDLPSNGDEAVLA